MDLILAGAHADVEVSVDALHESVTLLDLVQVLSPAQAPKVVHVDGRPLPAGTLVSAAGVVNGSVLGFTPPPPGVKGPVVTLVQIAGEGAGSRCPLRPGRYAIGPARRANVSAMALSEVLQAQIELTVDHDLGVTVSAGEGTLDGRRAVEATRWDDQHLRVGNRVFRLEPALDDVAVLVERTATGQLELGPPDVSANGTANGGANGTANGTANGGGVRVRSTRRTRHALGLTPPSDLFDPSAPPAGLARRRHPDVAEVVRRASVRSTRLWRRSPADPEAFRFSVGLADQLPAGTPEAGEVLWPTVPAVVDLSAERGVAIVSPALHARAAARALVLQACVVHRPDDLDVVVLADASGASRWEWVKWLPHARSSQGVQLFSDPESIADWLNAQRTLSTVVAAGQVLDHSVPPARVTLVVIDDPALWRGRSAVLRGVFAETNLPLRFVALTDAEDDVPAVCSTIVTVLPSGSARVESSTAGTCVVDVAPFVLDYDVAAGAARRLSPLVERSAGRTERATLPAQVSLASLVDVEGLDAGRMADRWQAAQLSRRLRFPIGVGLAGVVELDLVDDGPSALIVGAPRSGKTDTLCNLLASVLLSAGPQAVSVVTVEATPRSTFDELANLPHVVGRIEQFNDRRGARLLRSLRAEAAARARAVRNLQVESISEYNATVDVDPLPRLVIAVDDADVIAGRSATFLPQLVEIVESARPLGLHLLLSSGQFSASFQATVRTLSGARVALRMHDPAEAIELVGTREPVHLSSHAPGRAVIATRTAAARSLQIASASASWSGLLDMVPFVVARGLNATERRLAAATNGDDLVPGRGGSFRSVREVIEATQRIVADANAGHAVRTVLAPELPGLVPFDDLRERSERRADAVAIGLADLPDEQRTGTHWWRPGCDGNIALIGGTAAERAEVVATYALAAGGHFPASHLLLYLVDASSQQLNDHVPLDAIERLRNCAGAVTIDDPDRVLRLLGHLDTEVDRRAAMPAPDDEPTIVLLINDVAALLRHFESGGDFELGGKMLSRIIEVGPSHGISTVITAAGESGVPPEILAEFPGRVLLSLDDRADYRAFAVEAARIPSAVAGRALTLPEQIEIQFASTGELEPAVQAVLDLAGESTPHDAGGEDVPARARIAPTPESIGHAALAGVAGHDDHGWSLPVGLHAHTLQPLALPLSRGDAALIVGEAGTGKAAVLDVVVRSVLDTRGGALVHAIAAARRPYFDLAGFASAATGAGIGALIDDVLHDPAHEHIVIVDEAGLPDDAALHRLAQSAGGSITIVVAGRARRLDEPDHWSAPLRRFRTGVLLRPLAGDGAIFGLQVSTSVSQALPNRGLLVHHGSTTPVLLPNQPGPNGAST